MDRSLAKELAEESDHLSDVSCDLAVLLTAPDVDVTQLRGLSRMVRPHGCVVVQDKSKLKAESSSPEDWIASAEEEEEEKDGAEGYFNKTESMFKMDRDQVLQQNAKYHKVRGGGSL